METSYSKRPDTRRRITIGELFNVEPTPPKELRRRYHKACHNSEKLLKKIRNRPALPEGTEPPPTA
jgi:hypothetical protein